MKYKFLEHTADIKFQAFGENKEELFENSALALKNVISEDKIKPRIKKEIIVKGKNLEELLYNFLEEFLVLFDEEGFVLSSIGELGIKEERKYILRVNIYGDFIDGSREKNYEISNHVKAITYSEMFIKKPETGKGIKKKWITQVVIDV